MTLATYGQSLRCGSSVEGAQFVSTPLCTTDQRGWYRPNTLSDSFSNLVYYLGCALLFPVFTYLGFQPANFIVLYLYQIEDNDKKKIDESDNGTAKGELY